MSCFTYSFHMPLLFCRNVSVYVLKQLIKLEWFYCHSLDRMINFCKMGRIIGIQAIQI